MRKLVLLLVCVLSGPAGRGQTTLNGAGATFPLSDVLEVVQRISQAAFRRSN